MDQAAGDMNDQGAEDPQQQKDDRDDDQDVNQLLKTSHSNSSRGRASEMFPDGSALASRHLRRWHL